MTEDVANMWAEILGGVAVYGGFEYAVEMPIDLDWCGGHKQEILFTALGCFERAFDIRLESIKVTP